MPADTNGARIVTVTVSKVMDLKGLAGVAADYEQLCGDVGNRLPFALYDWHLTWCRHFLNYHPHIQDEPRFCLVHNPGGRCVAILPLIQSSRRLGPCTLPPSTCSERIPPSPKSRPPWLRRDTAPCPFTRRAIFSRVWATGTGFTGAAWARSCETRWSASRVSPGGCHCRISSSTFPRAGKSSGPV